MKKKKDEKLWTWTQNVEMLFVKHNEYAYISMSNIYMYIDTCMYIYRLGYNAFYYIIRYHVITINRVKFYRSVKLMIHK